MAYARGLERTGVWQRRGGQLAVPTRASEHKRRHDDQERDAGDDDDDKYRQEMT